MADTPSPAVDVTVHADQPGPKIDRDLYGQFAEHLGRGIYEGVWVGEGSSIPNTRGFRNDVLAALKALGVPVVRWPGGCFADIYHWRDGIGPRSSRPVTINATWGGVEESNAFGTHEFLDFAELIGARAYINGNVGTGTPQEMADWIEYITSPTRSSLAELRRKNGRDRPWRLPFFAVGNETWGCGGGMRAEHYADVYRNYATFIRGPSDNRPSRVASGANSGDVHWTETLMAQAAGSMDAITLHHYTLPTGRWDHKGPGRGFGEADWIATLQGTLQMDGLIAKHAAVMDTYDPGKRVGLFVDEWGTWYDATPGTNTAFLEQPNTLRDAVAAALNLGIFHAHADRVRMANIAQMVNVLQAMILTDKDKMVLTPTYYVFEMYRPFQDATFLPADVATPAYELASASVPMVQASAARDASGGITLALVNLDPHRSANVKVKIAGALARAVSGRVLTAAAMDAENTFGAPEAVKPAALQGARVDHGGVAVVLPAKAVAVLRIQ
ncbi:MAG TPA: alpha-L-arabinofuranosidase C-terminal domain-containing protein [Polyangiaceae bacterium]